MRRNCLETRSSAIRFRGGSGGKTSEAGRARERARMRARSSSGKVASERDILGLGDTAGQAYIQSILRMVRRLGEALNSQSGRRNSLT